MSPTWPYSVRWSVHKIANSNRRKEPRNRDENQMANRPQSWWRICYWILFHILQKKVQTSDSGTFVNSAHSAAVVQVHAKPRLYIRKSWILRVDKIQTSVHINVGINRPFKCSGWYLYNKLSLIRTELTFEFRTSCLTYAKSLNFSKNLRKFFFCIHIFYLIIMLVIVLSLDWVEYSSSYTNYVLKVCFFCLVLLLP